MKLKIITPEEKLSFAIAWLEVQTSTGSFVIQSGHAPMILMLKPEEPVVFLLKSGKRESITIVSGILEVNRTSATILISGSNAS